MLLWKWGYTCAYYATLKQLNLGFTSFTSIYIFRTNFCYFYNEIVTGHIKYSLRSGKYVESLIQIHFTVKPYKSRIISTGMRALASHHTGHMQSQTLFPYACKWELAGARVESYLKTRIFMQNDQFDTFLGSEGVINKWFLFLDRLS
jgi:hypothetical protein